MVNSTMLLDDGEQQEIANQTSSNSSSSNVRPPEKMKNHQMWNILVLSVAFLLLFSSFNTANYIQKVVVNSINKETGVGWDAYLSLCIVYFVFSVSNFIVPSVHIVLSAKFCMFFSSLAYFLYTIAFFHPFRYGLELVSALVGFSAALLWTTHGLYISNNSNSSTINRNCSIFWAIYQFSLVFGNLYFYLQFQGVEVVTKEYRYRIYTVLSITGAIGCLTLLFLKQIERRPADPDAAAVDDLPVADEKLARHEDAVPDKIDQEADLAVRNLDEADLPVKANPLAAFIRCFTLFKTKKMLLLSVACFYTGIEQSFFGGVYATAVAFTKHFGVDSVKLIGLYGISNGVGAIWGAVFFGYFLNERFEFAQRSRTPVFLIGSVGQLIALVLIYLNHPNRSPIEETEGFGAFGFEPQVWICLLCGFLLCLGDALFNVQVISLIGTMYTETSDKSSAYALFKFTHSIGASLTFFYASYDLTLDVHLIILVVFVVLGTGCFYAVEKLAKNEPIFADFSLALSSFHRKINLCCKQ